MFTDLGKTSPQGNDVITELICLETSVVQRVGNVIQCESFMFSYGTDSLDKVSFLRASGPNLAIKLQEVSVNQFGELTIYCVRRRRTQS